MAVRLEEEEERRRVQTSSSSTTVKLVVVVEISKGTSSSISISSGDAIKLLPRQRRLTTAPPK